MGTPDGLAAQTIPSPMECALGPSNRQLQAFYDLIERVFCILSHPLDELSMA